MSRREDLVPVGRSEPPQAAIQTRRKHRSVGQVGSPCDCLVHISECDFEPQRAQVNAGVGSADHHFAQCRAVNGRADSLFDRQDLQQSTAERFPHDGSAGVRGNEPHAVRRKRQRRHGRRVSGQSLHQRAVDGVVKQYGIIRQRDTDPGAIATHGQPRDDSRSRNRPRDFAIGRRPDANRFVGRGGDDLRVVRRHRDAHHGSGMSFETLLNFAGERVPEPDGIVRRTRRRLSPVGIECDSGHGRGVSTK